MQYYINTFVNGLPILMLSVIIAMGLFFIISRAKILQEKRLNKELLECIECKDAILEEFKKMRHDYNNILQTLTFFIENEDLEGLKMYQSKLLEKTHLLNNNNLAQLVKIKDKNTLRTVYQLFRDAKEAGIALNLTIYNDINDIGSYKAERYNVLQEYLKYAYDTAVKEAVEIDLKISANNTGLRFYFENCSGALPETLLSKPIKSQRKVKDCKDIFFNTFLQNNHRIQEIMVSFNRQVLKIHYEN